MLMFCLVHSSGMDQTVLARVLTRVIVTGHIVRSGIYETVWYPSVCLSQHGPTAANPLLQVCCCGPVLGRTLYHLLLWARWAGDNNGLLQQWENAGSATSAYIGS